MEDIIIHTKRRILPLISTIAVAIGFTLLGILSGFFNFETAFIPEGQGGIDPLVGLINASILITIAIIGAFIIYFTLKYGKEKALKYFFYGCFFLIGSFMLFLFGVSILYMFSLYDFFSFISVVVISIAIGFFLTYFIFSKKFKRRFKNIALLIFGALIGSFLGLVLPLWTSFLLLIGLAIYDMFAVFKGPIKKILKLTEEKQHDFCEISYSTPDYDIGLGDLTFYSMLTCLTSKFAYNTTFLNEWGIIGLILPPLVSIIGILIGALITFKLLEKKEVLPGLPISIGLGIGFFSLVILIFWLI